MRCDICNFDSNGNYVPNDQFELKCFLVGDEIELRLESGGGITQAIARGCWICRTIRDALLPFNRYLFPEWYCKHDDLDILGGCKECLLVKNITLNFGADPSHEVEIVVGDSNLNGYQETFCIIGNGIPWPQGLKAWPEGLNAWPGALKATPTSRIEYLLNLARYSRLDQARAWLDRCTLEHPGCQQSPCSPKRLLEIRDRLDDEPSVRLHSPRDSVKYACLSYCWGQSRNLETLKNNLKRHLHKVPFEDLPRTIQDAVRICLALRIYYLWVDALCIVQDDENDWASECTRMGDIYSGAHVTLAAVQGHHSEAGLLRVKPIKVARINVWPPTGSPTGALVYRQSQHSYPDAELHQQHLKQRPLLTRGWVYQELLLSPKILRFDAEELSFECREGMMCECGQPPDLNSDKNFRKILESNKKHPLTNFIARRRDFSLVENGLISHSNAFTLWYRMVEQYSSMTLTKQSDRLPAFSAIAAKFSRYGGRYYAGVWENDFITGLHWYPLPNTSHRRSHHQASATDSTPSWSWTSQPDSIVFDTFYDGDRTCIAKISITNLVLSNTANIFGGVLRGYLDASSLLKPARLEINKGPANSLSELYNLCRNDRLSTGELANASVNFLPDYTIPCELEAKLLSTPNSVCCFVLTKESDMFSSIITNCLVLGLIDEKKRLYRRIGFMGEYCRVGQRSWFDDAKEARILIQ